MLKLIQTNSRLKIGLLGGSFDPPHLGHLSISTKAIKLLNLDQVWWLITPQNPLKPNPPMLSIAERKNLAVKIIKNNKILVSDIEATFNNCYTENSTRRLKRQFPNYQFIMLMGMDNFVQLHKWHRWQNLARSIAIVVFDRDIKQCASSRSKASVFTNNVTNARMIKYVKNGHHLLKMQKIPIASSLIRRQ